MINRIFTVLLCFALLRCHVQAQTNKQISGPFQTALEALNKHYLTVSSDGNEIAFYQEQYHVTLRVDEGIFSVVKKQWPSLRSDDLSLEYTNLKGHYYMSNMLLPKWPEATPLGENENACLISNSGEMKPVKIIRSGTYLLAINRNRQLLLSEFFSDPAMPTAKGLKGLWIADFHTQKGLYQLRRDTLLKGNPNDNVIFFNANRSALIRVLPDRSIQYLPFASDSIVTIEGLQYRYHYDPEFADDHYLYVPDDKNSDLRVYSLHTGKLLFKKEFPGVKPNPAYFYRRCLYYIAPGEGLYRLDREEGKLYHEIPDGQNMHILNEWSLDKTTFPLDDSQDYRIAVCKGPSLLIVPRVREIGTNLKNTGYLIELASGKTKLSIAPFYTPSADVLAEEEARWKAYKEKNDAYHAKEQAKNEAQKAAECAGKLHLQGIAIGSSVAGDGKEGVLLSFDCKTDVYVVWVPKHLLKYYEKEAFEVPGYAFRTNWSLASGTWVICDACHGTGTTSKQVTGSHTHELPQGYFSGIRTTKTVTWTQTEVSKCQACKGSGKVKK